MSSSSSRVLRAGAAARAADLAVLDLAPQGLARLDPARVDAAVAEGREAGYRAGFAAGEAAGRAEAAARWGDELAAVVRAGDDAVTEALAGLRAVADATAQRITRVAFELAEAIVGRELALATAPGRDAVARALSVAPEDVELVLHLHPGDAAALGPDGLPAGRAVRVVPDPAVEPGGCVARAGWTSVDATLGTALERVRAVLEEGA